MQNRAASLLAAGDHEKGGRKSECPPLILVKLRGAQNNVSVNIEERRFGQEHEAPHEISWSAERLHGGTSTTRGSRDRPGSRNNLN